MFSKSRQLVRSNYDNSHWADVQKHAPDFSPLLASLFQATATSLQQALQVRELSKKASQWLKMN